MDTLTFIMDQLKLVFSMILSFTPMVLGVLAALVIGTILARTVSRLTTSLLKSAHLDKHCHAIGLDTALAAGGLKKPVTELIGSLFGIGLTLTALVIALSYAGVTLMPLTDPIKEYVPTVLTAVISLMVAMFLAHLVAIFVRLIAANTDMPKPELLATLTKWAIVLMALRTFIDKIGIGYLFEGVPLLIMTAAVALGLGLAFGLGGRDHASKYLDRILKS